MTTTTTPVAAAASSSTTSSTSSTQSAITSATDGLGRDAFLKLLIAQLQNQDPMKPMEDKEFIAQLAQFSSLETLQNLESRIDSMISSQSVDQASGLIGKHIEAEVQGVNGDTETVTGAVTEVRVLAGVPKLLVGDKEIYLGDITKVSS
jgi:flagellar basal-body rod modification protein FlgD